MQLKSYIKNNNTMVTLIHSNLQKTLLALQVPHWLFYADFASLFATLAAEGRAKCLKTRSGGFKGKSTEWHDIV
jgi:hypothetical protein